jgi:hypothetical protein
LHGCDGSIALNHSVVVVAKVSRWWPGFIAGKPTPADLGRLLAWTTKQARRNRRACFSVRIGRREYANLSRVQYGQM